MLSLDQRIQGFQDICRANGLKITPQRLEVFKELASSSEHPTAEQIFARIRQRMPTVSLDTVYRTLSTLTKSGVVSRVEVLDDQSRFDANIEKHHHFICVRCQRVIDFDWPDFDSLKIPDEIQHLGTVDQPHAELRGICKDCLKK